MTKKIISVLLAVIMVFAAAIPAFAAYDSKKDGVNDYPVILIPGYSSSALKLNNEDGSYTQVWGLDFDKVFALIGEHAFEILTGAGYGLTSKGDFEYLAKVVGEEFIKLCDVISCNPDGSSKYDVDPMIPATADATRWTNLPESERKKPDMINNFLKYMSEDDIYNFSCDFRLGVMENSERLNDLIQDIIDTTGCEKVNLVAESHGGQVVATYLSVHGTEGKVNNCVMCVPAMGGAALAYDILTKEVDFDEESLIRFIEFGMEEETDYHWLLAAQSLGFLDDLLVALIPYVYQVLGNWISIWDFVPNDYFYDTVKMLDPVENAKLIETTTWFHENIMAKYEENLNIAKDAGVNITILAGTGMPVISGLKENSDAIIRVKDSSGATCAPYGYRFADGYSCVGSNCDDSSHNHLSPAMQVDASTCWLPENTWFVEGMYHGMEVYDTYTMSLIMKQLISERPLTSVHDSKDYPQFHTSTNKSLTVSAMFNNSVEGYLSSEDNSLILINTTESATVRVYDVRAEGVKIAFDDFNEIVIRSGQTKELKFSATLPEESGRKFSITIVYGATDSATPIGSRTIDFTLMNGDKVDFDESNMYVPVDKATLDHDGGDIISSVIKKAGLVELVNAITRFMTKIFKFMKDMFMLIIS